MRDVLARVIAVRMIPLQQRPFEIRVAPLNAARTAQRAIPTRNSVWMRSNLDGRLFQPGTG